MRVVVVDASALAALAFHESAGSAVRAHLEGATVYAPVLLQYELANVAWKKARRQPADGAKILASLALVLDIRGGIVWHDVSPVDVVLIAEAAGVTAYDASYLWLAGWLGAELITLDRQLSEASARLTA